MYKLKLLTLFSPLETFEISDYTLSGLLIPESIAFIIFGAFYAILNIDTYGLEDNLDEEDEEDLFEDLLEDLNDTTLEDNLEDGNDDDDLAEHISILFSVIFFGNLLNLVPFNDTNNNFLLFTLYLSSSIFLALNLNGVLVHHFSMINLFLPQGVPSFLRPLLFVIEFISYFARMFSLGIRLFANMMSGHILIAILSTFIIVMLININVSTFAVLLLISVVTAIFFLELIIAFLQAYVFSMLVVIYYGDAVNLHHG